MSDIRTNLKIKTSSNTYTQKYPTSHSNIVRRDTTTTSSIIGTNLQDCLQSTANRYCPQNGKSWIEYTRPAASGAVAVCSDGNFLFVKVGDKFKWSFNGGKTFTGSGEYSFFSTATMMSCKRVKVDNVTYSYHIVAPIGNKLYAVRIDEGDSGLHDAKSVTLANSFPTPTAVFFTDGAWYVYSATAIAKITNLGGQQPIVNVTQPSEHTHMSKAIYAPEMGMYVTVDNGNVVLSSERLGGESV